MYKTCKSLQWEGCLPSAQHQEGTDPLVLSQRWAAASWPECPHSCCSFQGSLRSCMHHYQCRLYAAVDLHSFPQKEALRLPRGWNVSWKAAVHSQKWAVVSGAPFFVWT